MEEKFNFCNKLDRAEILDIFCRSTDMTRAVDKRIEIAQKYFNPVDEVIIDILEIFIQFGEI